MHKKIQVKVDVNQNKRHFFKTKINRLGWSLGLLDSVSFNKRNAFSFLYLLLLASFCQIERNFINRNNLGQFQFLYPNIFVETCVVDEVFLSKTESPPQKWTDPKLRQCSDEIWGLFFKHGTLVDIKTSNLGGVIVALVF